MRHTKNSGQTHLNIVQELTTGTGQTPRLTPDEWASGDIVWLIDVVGAQRGLVHALDQAADRWSGDDVKLVARGGNGETYISTLSDLLTNGTGLI
jgi:hypothetical protein